MEKTPFIGESPEIKKVIKKTHKIAKNSFITVLILGENGTGKELVARMVHEYSPNADKPFVDINCGALPETLLESELFGFEKGAFTGASGQKKGLFEMADGGTLFLDEICNTSINFQSKLLKVVENKRFRRLGGLEEISVKVRIITATNIDLHQAVRDGDFRQDLYYRLNVGQIFIPPLRNRRGDIKILAEHFIQEFNRDYKLTLQGIRPSAMELLLNYPWPGNVRQLKNVLEQAALIEAHDWIEVKDIKLDYETANITHPIEQEPVSPPVNVNMDKFRFPTKGIALEELERGIIISAIEKANGNLSQAARLLKISRGKLRYRLDKLGIDPVEIHSIRGNAL